MKSILNKLIVLCSFYLLLLWGCQTGTSVGNIDEPQYTCPMPTDSFFSDHPGKCPKCGMELIPVKHDSINHSMAMGNMNKKINGYTCPMHPQVFSDTAGNCPLCGMKLEKIKPAARQKEVSLETLLRPVNQEVVASIPMVHKMQREEKIEMQLYGFVNYDPSRKSVISSNVSGRIEKIFVRYRFQKISKGQKIMEIYSPELVTAQENLLFLLKNDPGNATLIEAARKKLLLLGMHSSELKKVGESGKPLYTVSVYSPYAGHIHEAMDESKEKASGENRAWIESTTAELSIKEGMYVTKGRTIFSIFDPSHAWVTLNIFAGQSGMVNQGDSVQIVPETNPDESFRSTIRYIEPVFRDGNKTLMARVYFDNNKMKIPIGTQVKGLVSAGNRQAYWLPDEAVLSLGMEKVVFVRTGEAFRARKIETGIASRHLVQVLDGLAPDEAVAANAQFLVDSESFIKTDL